MILDLDGEKDASVNGLTKLNKYKYWYTLIGGFQKFLKRIINWTTWSTPSEYKLFKMEEGRLSKKDSDSRLYFMASVMDKRFHLLRQH